MKKQHVINIKKARLPKPKKALPIEAKKLIVRKMKEYMYMLLCPYCGKGAQLVKGNDIYPDYYNIGDKYFYICKRCDARVGCCPGTTKPLGTLANKRLRQLRSLAHFYFDKKWTSGEMTRSEAYRWLADKLGIFPRNDCHIGMMDERYCKKVIRACGGDTKL